MVFRKIVFKIAAAFLLMLATLGLSIPVNAYTQTGGNQVQSAYASGKCGKVKNKQKKKQ